MGVFYTIIGYLSNQNTNSCSGIIQAQLRLDIKDGFWCILELVNNDTNKMVGFYTNIEADTLSNTNYRKVLYTAPHSQLVLMSLLPGEEIGMEVHPNVDQFFRFEAGEGMAVLNGEETHFKDGDVIIVPAGTNHNIVNTSSTEPLKLYTVYSPANHPDGTVHATKAEAEAGEALYEK